MEAQAVDHAFAGYTDKYGPSQGGEAVQMGEQLIILLYGLGKTESRVQDPVTDAVLFRSFSEFSEIFQNFFHHILILAERLHGLRIAALVHCHIPQSEPSDCRQHLRVVLSGRDIIDYERSYGVVCLFHHRSPVGIDGYAYLPEMLPHFLQKRSEPAPFLFGSDGLRAWTGGACAYVYDVRSFLQHLPYPVESMRNRNCPSD